MTTSTVLAWALISISSGLYNNGTITTLKEYEKKEECFAVAEFNQANMPDYVEFTCIKTQLENLEVEAKDVNIGDLLILSDGRSGIVQNSIADPKRKDTQLIEFNSAKTQLKSSKFYRIFLPTNEIVSVIK